MAKGPPVHVRTREEIVQETRDQLRMLIRFANDYMGEHDETAGKYMAGPIFMICNDGYRSQSLISQLGYNQTLTCIDTAVRFQIGWLRPLALTLDFHPQPVGPPVPRAFLYPRKEFQKIPFEQWWSQTVYCEMDGSGALSRQAVVHYFRSQDGAAGHFDSVLTSQSYLNLKQGGGWVRGNNLWGPEEEQEVFPPDPTHLLTLWSIAWELHTSFMELDGQLRPTPLEGA